MEEDRYPGYNIGEYLFIVASVLLLWISISDFVEAYIRQPQNQKNKQQQKRQRFLMLLMIMMVMERK